MIVSYRLFFETQGRKQGRNLKLVMYDVSSKGGFTRQSNAGDVYLQPANDGGNLQHQVVQSA